MLIQVLSDDYVRLGVDFILIFFRDKNFTKMRQFLIEKYF